MAETYTLIPYCAAEGMTVKQAAQAAGKSERTIRAWCEIHGIGRRVAGGPWIVSRVALLMLLEGDDAALTAYRDGARGSYDQVARYFHRAALAHLLDMADFAV